MNDLLDKLQFPALCHDLRHPTRVNWAGRRSSRVPWVDPLQRATRQTEINTKSYYLLWCKQTVLPLRRALINLRSDTVMLKCLFPYKDSGRTQEMWRVWKGGGKVVPLPPVGWRKMEGYTCRNHTLFLSLPSGHPSIMSSEGLWQLGERFWG